MATLSSPKLISRKPLPQSSPISPKSPKSPKYDLYSEGENAANESQKLLPAMPIPSPTRTNGQPLSPIRVSVAQENWPPQASSAIIEDANGDIRRARESELFRTGDFENGRVSPIMPVSADIPYRPSYTSPNSGQMQSQTAIISSGDNSGSSRSPSNSSSTGKQGPRKIHPDRIDEDAVDSVQPVPLLQYHHQPHFSESMHNLSRGFGNQSPHNDYAEMGQTINRHLTPNSQMHRGTPNQRPNSAYSDMGPHRGRSPVGHFTHSPSWGHRAPSANSARSHDGRPMSYVDLANISYPQAPPAPISLDNSQLRSVVGSNASLLSTAKTIEMYRQNIKKLNDAETQYAFAIFLIQAAQEAGLNLSESATPRKSSPKPGARDLDSPYIDKSPSSPQELVTEAKHILRRLADKSYPFAQYYLADGYASGLFNKGKEDYGAAFPLFVAASKHGHAESGYRAALCYEFGWGTGKDAAKAVQYYRQSASKNHPGAMTRLGRACLSGDLGQNKYREGLKWLKRATESADLQYNAAPYHLGLLFETGYGDDIFQDVVYTSQLFTQAADLGHPEACYRLGDAYEHGKLSCPRDPALSVHFYTGAAQRGHPAAMMALCAWYMVGAEPVLEKDENEAYEWARQAAECGLTKAEYAVGYFTEMGIGTRRDPLEANVWYVRAAEAGDERAKHRLQSIRAAASGGIPMEVAPPRNGGKIKKSSSQNDKLVNSGEQKGEKECIIM